MAEIIAEISGNHGGDEGTAVELIEAAADAGCDYVKFQYYQPADMPWTGPDDYEMYAKLAVPPFWLPRLFRAAKEQCIGLFASVFNPRVVPELLQYDTPYIKIASPTSTPLSKATYLEIAEAIPADIGVIISSDLAHFEEMAEIFPDAMVMWCPPGHPPTPETSLEYLREIRNLYVSANFGVAFSDHTPGLRLPVKALDWGVPLLEKHFKLDDNCVDAKFSADFETMRILCRVAHHK